MEPVTEDQVRAAIAVLKAYVDGTLRTDLCDELDEAIEKAFNLLCEEKSGDPEWLNTEDDNTERQTGWYGGADPYWGAA